jgi:hypothetical protein
MPQRCLGCERCARVPRARRQAESRTSYAGVGRPTQLVFDGKPAVARSGAADVLPGLMCAALAGAEPASRGWLKRRAIVHVDIR